MALTNNTVNDDINLLNDATDCYKLSKDQYGCRYLQKQLENDTADKQYLNIIFKNLLTNYQELAVDPFGNYLLQKIVEYLDEPSLELLILELQPNLYSISKNQFGTRSLQKIIDCIYQYDGLCETFITDGFMKISVTNIVDLINDINANHVIQKCIFKFKNFYYDFIINAMVTNNNIIKISKNKHGCCVLQKLLSNCNIQQIYKIMLKILEYDFDLINDQFGNYIVQFLLDVNTEIIITDGKFYDEGQKKNKMSLNLCYIIKFMELENLDLIKLSCLKFSSNVIEKLLITFFDKLNQYMKITKDVLIEDDESLLLLQKHMLKIITLFNKNINTLIKDNYGNYTLQTLLDTHNYQNLIERYWILIKKFKPLENLKDQENFKISLNSTGWVGIDDDLGNNYDEEVKLQKGLKFFSDMVANEDAALSGHDVFVIKFVVEINDLIKSAHSLLGQIKNTSYSKKIKLKLKRYYQEIYHSSNVPKSLNINGATNSKNFHNNEIPNSNNQHHHQSSHSRKHSNSHNKSHGSHSRGHSISQSSNGRTSITPKQHSHNNSIGNVDANTFNQHNTTVSSGPALLDTFGTNVTTPIDVSEFQNDALMEGYFDSRINGNNANAWNYYNNMNNGMVEQHQRHFSLPSTTYKTNVQQQDNMWAVKPNPNNGFNEGRSHIRTNSLVDQANYARGSNFSNDVQQPPHVSMNQYANSGNGGYISPNGYRQMPPSQQGMNYTPMDYTDAYIPSGQPMPKLSNYGHRQQLSVGNNTIKGHKKELSTNSSNNTTVVNPVFGHNMSAAMPPFMTGHKPSTSIGSIGSDVNSSNNAMGLGNAPVLGATSIGQILSSGNNNFWTMNSNNGSILPGNGHIRHSSQGSIWGDQYNSTPGHNRSISNSQGYPMNNGNSGNKGMVQQTLQDQDYLNLPQQYNYN